MPLKNRIVFAKPLKLAVLSLALGAVSMPATSLAEMGVRALVRRSWNTGWSIDAGRGRATEFRRIRASDAPRTKLTH